MPPGQRRSNVRRSNVTACHRCKSRKQRCDQRIPACSNCERAGAECVGTDIDGRVAPRSYIKSLEDRIAQLETQLISHGIQDQVNDTPSSLDFPAATNHAVFNSPSSQGHSSQADEDLVGQIVFDSLKASQFPNAIINHNGLSLLNSLLSGPINKVSRPGPKSDHRTLFEDLPYETRVDMPRGEAANRLIDTYFEHCDFFSPVLSSKEHLTATIAPLYDASSSGGHSLTKVKFRASMVFATAILLINRIDPSVPVERSQVYFAAAMHLLSKEPAICTGDLDHLTDLLLIVQYCCFCPNLTAAWHFLGLATRLVVELDLHNERGCASALDPALADERRWLFWATYTFERNLCVILGRPFSIPDEAVETPLPPEPDDNPRRAQALHLIKARRFESEIYSVLRQKHPPNGMTLDKLAWRASMTQRLQDWFASTPPADHASQLTPQQIFQGFLHNSFVNMYYPSRHFPDVSHDEIATLARHASDSISCYKQSFRSRELRFYWRNIHNLFRAGVALVYCIRASALQQVAGVDVSAWIDTVNSCLSIMWALIERYPQGQAYRDIFENLVNSVLGKDNGQPVLQSADDQAFMFNSLFTASEETDLPFTAIDALSWGFAPSE